MESIRYFLKAAFRAAIIVPLTAGNSISPNKPQDTDGSLASMVTIACLTAISFVIIGIYGGKQTTVDEAHYVVWSLIMSMIVLALVCVIVIAVVAYRHRLEWFVHRTASIRQGSLKLKIMFLWLFGFAIILETTLSLAINVDCLSHDSKDLYSYRIASIASNLLSIIYYCLQMGFISYFIGYKFEGYIRINYGILIILLANLTHWFNSVVSEANKSFYRRNETDDDNSYLTNYRTPGSYLTNYANLFHDVHGNGTDPLSDCYWKSKIQDFLQALMPYLIPARIEYFLLATGFILGMWPSVKQDENSHEEDENEFNTQLSESFTEASPLLQNSSYGSTSMNSSHSEVRSSSNPISFFLSIVFGIALNLPLLVCDLVLNFIPLNTTVIFITWQVIVCIYKSIMLIMATCIFLHLSKIAVSETHTKKLTANEYILIFSAAGSVAMLTFGVIAGIQTRTVRGNLALADSLIDIVTIYVQTVLIIHSERKTRSGDVVRTCCATEHLILLLAISNFIFWVIDSFIDNNYKKDLYIQYDYFGKSTWNKVREILFPILIFYRFHASIDLYGFFCKFRQ